MRISYFLNIIFFVQILFFGNCEPSLSNSSVQEKPFLILINPAGHAKSVGRRLVESVERAVTFKFAESLQKEMQEKYQLRVVLTRYPGEEIVDWESASFANRLGVDFYLSLHVYREEVVKPKIFLYHLLYNPMVDLAYRSFDTYSFIPVHQAHFANIGKTRFWGKCIKDVLSTDWHKKRFDFYGLYGIPLRPLCGIIAPALAIEVGICQEDQWKSLVDPLVDSLGFLVQNELEKA